MVEGGGGMFFKFCPKKICSPKDHKSKIFMTQKLFEKRLNDFPINHCTKNEVFRLKNFFSKCEQIYSFLRIWSHSLKKS